MFLEWTKKNPKLGLTAKKRITTNYVTYSIISKIVILGNNYLIYEKVHVF